MGARGSLGGDTRKHWERMRKGNGKNGGTSRERGNEPVSTVGRWSSVLLGSTVSQWRTRLEHREVSHLSGGARGHLSFGGGSGGGGLLPRAVSPLLCRCLVPADGHRYLQ